MMASLTIFLDAQPTSYFLLSLGSDVIFAQLFLCVASISNNGCGRSFIYMCIRIAGYLLTLRGEDFRVYMTPADVANNSLFNGDRRDAHKVAEMSCCEHILCSFREGESRRGD